MKYFLQIGLIVLNEQNIFSKTVQISTFRDKVQKIIAQIKRLTENTEKVSSIELFKIENSLDTIINETEIWEGFKVQFEKIRPQFFKK